jgi:CBS domain containing-hemolysin-like protein
MEIFSQISLVLLFVFLNGFFVAAEFALVAVRKTRIEELVKKGNTRAKLVQKAIPHLDTYISATQFGITLSSLALGWIGEPAIARFLEPLLHAYLPSSAAVITSHGVAFTIAFSIITFLHIVLGELAPKSIALQKPEQTSLLIIAPLTLFATVFRPFVALLNGAGGLVLRLIGFPLPDGHTTVHSEEEIKLILTESAQQGAIEKEEAEMVRGALRFDDVPVSHVMIPRQDMIAFDIHTPLKEAIQKAEKNLHSRFPVYKDSIDTIVGFVHIKELYKRAFTEAKKEGTLAATPLIRTILKVPETHFIDDVLLAMRKRRVHIAIVQNTEGKTAGVVTLEDILESLVGEIQDEFEPPEPFQTEA